MHPRSYCSGALQILELEHGLAVVHVTGVNAFILAPLLFASIHSKFQNCFRWI